jgi:hypothetical protein
MFGTFPNTGSARGWGMRSSFDCFDEDDDGDDAMDGLRSQVDL